MTGKIVTAVLLFALGSAACEQTEATEKPAPEPSATLTEQRQCYNDATRYFDDAYRFSATRSSGAVGIVNQRCYAIISDLQVGTTNLWDVYANRWMTAEGRDEIIQRLRTQ